MVVVLLIDWNDELRWQGLALARLLLYYKEEGVGSMLYYALIFLVVGLIAGALGIYGVAGVASQIAWVLFLIGIVFLIIHLISGSRRPIV